LEYSVILSEVEGSPKETADYAGVADSFLAIPSEVEESLTVSVYVATWLRHTHRATTPTAP
jgi:hypothetical protein